MTFKNLLRAKRRVVQLSNESFYTFKGKMVPCMAGIYGAYQTRWIFLSYEHSWFRRGRDNSLKSYGPIKITKCAINIHDKILETRLERVMNKLIHRDQVGFMRHEIITDSLKKGFMLMQIDNDTQTLVFANSLNTQEVCNRMK